MRRKGGKGERRGDYRELEGSQVERWRRGGRTDRLTPHQDRNERGSGGRREDIVEREADE